MLDDPGRVRSQITSVVCQIQRFDFDCKLVVTRKVMPDINTPTFTVALIKRASRKKVFVSRP